VSEKVAQYGGADRNLLRQHFTELGKGCVGMIGDDLPNFFFVGCQFPFSTGSIGSRSDTAGLVALLNERICPRTTDIILNDEVVDGNTRIVILQNPFS
jgi:hypothetical protein